MIALDLSTLPLHQYLVHQISCSLSHLFGQRTNPTDRSRTNYRRNKPMLNQQQRPNHINRNQNHKVKTQHSPGIRVFEMNSDFITGLKFLIDNRNTGLRVSVLCRNLLREVTTTTLTLEMEFEILGLEGAFSETVTVSMLNFLRIYQGKLVEFSEEEEEERSSKGFDRCENFSGRYI